MSFFRKTACISLLSRIDPEHFHRYLSRCLKILENSLKDFHRTFEDLQKIFKESLMILALCNIFKEFVTTVPDLCKSITKNLFTWRKALLTSIISVCLLLISNIRHFSDHYKVSITKFYYPKVYKSNCVWMCTCAKDVIFTHFQWNLRALDCMK